MADWIGDNPLKSFGLLAAALVALIAWAVIEDGKAMEVKRAAFMDSCLSERAEYDCALQWETYVEARAARMAANAAAANSGAAAANGAR